jgi:hypothetical protein
MSDTDTGPNGDQARSRLQRERDEARADALAAYERGKADASTEHRREMLGLRVRALAAGKVVDPADAHKFLDLDVLAEAGDDTIAKALDDLVASKPYLAPQSRRFGDADQGARSNGPSTADPVDAWLRGK